MGGRALMGSDFADLEAIRVMGRYYRWKADLVEPYLGPRVLEVGCGTGLLMERLAGRELMFGIDPDAACISVARSRFQGRPGVRAEVGGILGEDFLSLSGKKFTSVVFASSLEEVKDDRQAVRRAADLLEPGGRVVIFTAAIPEISGTLDSSFAARRYRPGELGSLLAAVGLKTLTLRYVNLLGAIGWMWDSRVVRRRSVSEGAYRRRDLVVPLARLVDRLTGPPFGRSLLAVGEKPWW